MADKTLKKALGEQVRAIRLARGLNQEQITVRLGVTARYYAGFERGEQNLMLDSVDLLAEQLGTAVILALDDR